MRGCRIPGIALIAIMLVSAMFAMPTHAMAAGNIDGQQYADEFVDQKLNGGWDDTLATNSITDRAPDQITREVQDNKIGDLLWFVANSLATYAIGAVALLYFVKVVGRGVITLLDINGKTQFGGSTFAEMTKANSTSGSRLLRFFATSKEKSGMTSGLDTTHTWFPQMMRDFAWILLITAGLGVLLNVLTLLLLYAMDSVPEGLTHFNYFGINVTS